MSKRNDEFWKKKKPPGQRDSVLPTEQETSDGALQRARYKLLMVPRGPKFRGARARAMADLAQIYWQRLQFDEAIPIWQQLADVVLQRGDTQQLGMVHAALAATLAQKGDYQPAIQHAQTALLHDPHNPLVMYTLGNAYDGACDDENALLWWRRLIEVKPDFSSAHGAIGSLHFRRGEFAAAEECFLRALASPTDSETTLNQLGNMYVTMGRFDDALARFRQAQRRWPKSPVAHNNMGDCFMRMECYPEAISAYEKRIDMRPKDALSAHLCLGVVLRLNTDPGSQERSKNHFENALAIYQSGQAQLFTRRIEHEARGALALTALDEANAVHAWQTVLDNPEVAHVGVGPIQDWRFLVALMQKSPLPPRCLCEVAALLAQKYGNYWGGP